MRFIEITKLSDFINDSRDFVEENDLAGIYAGIDAHNIISLQSAALLADRGYLDEVSKLLNVVISIIHHPHLTNKGEDVILRVEQANELGNDEFRQVLRDSKLWKRHGAGMIPEEVHYRQHIDELRIYENRFICYLVDLIDRELAGYSSFYLSKLPTLRSDTKYLGAGEIGEIIIAVDTMRRKIRYIKDTYFYKAVSVGKPLSGRIHPTNILTKDRLYRHCFKFYRTFVRYTDIRSLCADLCVYYVMVILKELYDRGFVLESHSKLDDVLRFRKDEISLSLEIAEGTSVILSVSALGAKEVRHLLSFRSGSEIETELDPRDFTDAETLSLWELASIDGEGGAICAPELSLVRTWLDSKLTLMSLDRRVYEKYCPVCASRGIDTVDGVHICRSCRSEYSFIDPDQPDKVWFRKIRR